MRPIVVDTNVMVSAALSPKGFPAQVIRYVLDQGEFLISAETAEELAEVLARTRLDRFVSMGARKLFYETLLEAAREVEITECITACRDPKDDKFLELAINGNAACIVTGDEDLLVLDPFRGVRIVTPRGFIEEFAVDA